METGRVHTDFAIPDSLGDLRGPAEGHVVLPLHLDWTSANGYDMSDQELVRVMYATGLREAKSPDDLNLWLDKTLLIHHWPRLNLPAYVRRAWDARFDELGGQSLAGPSCATR